MVVCELKYISCRTNWQNRDLKIQQRVQLRLQVQLYGTTKFLTGVRKIVVGSNLVAVFQFTKICAEDLVVKIASSKV